MRLAFILEGLSSYRGQRALCHGLITELALRGHTCRLYAVSDFGALPENTEWRAVPRSGLHDTARQRNCLQWIQNDLLSEPADCVIGFSAMPGLTVMVHGGGCYAAGDNLPEGAFSTVTGRQRQVLEWEATAFGPQGSAQSCEQILLLDQRQANVFSNHYPNSKPRLCVLPAAVAMHEVSAEQRRKVRPAMRATLNLAEGDFALLLVSSDLNAAGIDRAVTTLAQVREAQPSVNARLFLAGQPPSARVRRLIRRLGLKDHVQLVGGDVEVQALMQAVDLLVAPGHEGASGRALLEATAAGLPAVATEVCEYAALVRDARSGIVLTEPFLQEDFDRAVMRHIDGIFRADGRENALNYARDYKLYNLWQSAADLIEDKQAG